jgi:hypothetical protein
MFQNIAIKEASQEIEKESSSASTDKNARWDSSSSQQQQQQQQPQQQQQQHQQQHEQVFISLDAGRRVKTSNETEAIAAKAPAYLVTIE